MHQEELMVAWVEVLVEAGALWSFVVVSGSRVFHPSLQTLVERLVWSSLSSYASVVDALLVSLSHHDLKEGKRIKGTNPFTTKGEFD